MRVTEAASRRLRRAVADGLDARTTAGSISVKRALRPRVWIGRALRRGFLHRTQLFLQRRDQSRHYAKGQGNPRDNGRLDGLRLLRALDVALRQGAHVAE